MVEIMGPFTHFFAFAWTVYISAIFNGIIYDDNETYCIMIISKTYAIPLSNLLFIYDVRYTEHFQFVAKMDTTNEKLIKTQTPNQKTL